MLKEYLAEKNISLYKLSKDTGIAYSSLNDLANRRVTMDRCRVDFLRRISAYLNLSMDELYDICNEELTCFCEKYQTKIWIKIRNKKFYMSFDYQSERITVELYKVSDISLREAKLIAQWRAEDYIEERTWEDLKNGL